MADRRKKIAVRMLGVSWNDYERSAQQWWDCVALPDFARKRYAGIERWYEYIADNVPPDLTRPFLPEMMRPGRGPRTPAPAERSEP